MVLDVTATGDQGEKIFEASRIYMPQSSNSLDNNMVYGPTQKLGILRDTSIQPFTSKKEYFEIRLTEAIRKVTIEVFLSYQPRPGDVYPIHRTIKEVSLDNSL